MDIHVDDLLSMQSETEFITFEVEQRNSSSSLNPSVSSVVLKGCAHI